MGHMNSKNSSRKGSILECSIFQLMKTTGRKGSALNVSDYVRRRNSEPTLISDLFPGAGTS